MIGNFRLHMLSIHSNADHEQNHSIELVSVIEIP